jgi:hypothetical protein
MSEHDGGYVGTTFVINNEEPFIGEDLSSGFVACDHVASAHLNDEGIRQYRIERLALDGTVLKTITVDDEDIRETLINHRLEQYASKEEALEVARAAFPDK